jgi:hypothetical protein
MEPKTGRMKHGSLAFWLIAAGLLGMWASATNGIRHWSALTFGLRLCDAIFAAAGLTLVAAGAWLFLAGTKHRAAAATGAAAAAVFSVTLAAGVWTGAIPCTSPD